MGASAGGLEAFQTFFDHMPPDSGMAFVLVQHLDPRHETMMPELLGKHTSMPVQQVRDKTPVEPDRVYVIPANATLIIEGGILRVRSPADAANRRTPIDTLFRSLAEDQGGNAVCILLSGSGTDGTLGLRSVKEHGGMTMVQSPESAHHDSIVRSAIATGMVDHVLAPERMPDKLVEYVAYLRDYPSNPQAILEETGGDLVRICELLRRATGHDFSQYKKTTLVRRIQRRMQVLQAHSVAGYLERLRKDANEVDLLFRDLLIGVTHFFRDPEAFQALAKEAIPQIIARARVGDGLRIWTPGCATGEEAYSVAILLREALGAAKTLPRVQIFAGDIDDEALDVARQARYPEGIGEHVSPERLERFFIKHDHGYQVAKEIRELVIFSRHNVIRDPPFSRLDLIVCRNLLIYLEGELQRYLASLFHYALLPEAYLFLGPSESVAGPPEMFRAIDKKHRIFQRSETLGAPLLFLPMEADGGRRPMAVTLKTPPARVPARPGLLQTLERILLENYAPAWVIVNRQGEAVYFSPRTGRFLEPPAGQPNVDVVSMARKGLRLELRAALHKSLKTGQPVVHPDISVAANGEVQRINLAVRPVTELGSDPGLFMIVFQELGPAGIKKQETEGGLPTAAGHDTQALENELRTTKEHLQASIEEVETSNEELRAANEELQSSNEELQSTNEELQTSKEELQSVNEELETINVELTKKLEELDHVNSDLRNLFQSTRIPTLFLDNDLRIKKFTEAAKDVFRFIEADVGRALADIAPRITDGGLDLEAKEVLRTLAPKERRVWLADGSASYLMHMRPYRRLDNVIDGLVITFLDVTRQDQALEQQARLATVLESSHDAIVGRSFEGVITSWNPAATDLFGYTAEEALGGPISLIVPDDLMEQLEKTHRRVEGGEIVPPFETVRQSKNGRRIIVSATISPVRDITGRVVAAASFFRDISELKAAQAALEQEGRRKDEFLAMLSHELRNPLAPLHNCLDILRQGASGRSQVKKPLDIIDRQLTHLTALVDQLLDLSRITSGKMTLRRDALDLVEIVSTVFEDHRGTMEKAGLKLDLQLPGRKLWVKGDSLRLSQIVANLLSNACKYTDRGGSVSVAVESEPGAASISVSDTGIGLEPEFLAQLFGPLGGAGSRLAHGREGLGLGLALVKGLVAIHGGTVEASSDGPGHGSRFIVRLPVVKSAAATPRGRGARTEAPETPKGPPHRILVVEDNPDAAESSRIMLELAGHKVEVAGDGPTALRKARSFRPQVVICDVGLPGGMDGYVVAGSLRKDPASKSAYLIALTGYGREPDQEMALKAGFDVHLTKPADPDALRQLLSSIPGSRGK